ncbi:MAG: spondin domain-containing protein [Gammaproteobacteria bacterium]|nr:spondin domain-containing protein [Gammaproteobacteria bacterium]
MTIKPSNVLALALSGAVLAGCSSDNDFVPPPPPPPPAMATFEVTVDNLTNAQPLSPVAVIAHATGYHVFSVGSAATAGLEEQAEGGDNMALLAEAGADGDVRATASGAGPIGPGGTETITIEVLESDVATLRISTSSMLVNTNDAIAALDAVDVSTLAAGTSMTWRTIAYDAGTEANTEEAAHIPGPAGGGEGFNAARDDIADRVSMHAGVVGQDDGFATSGLNNQHRFDNPVARVRITRID